jgi:hypothetical protein
MDIGYLVVIIGTNLFGYVTITWTFYTPSLTIVKNCDTMLAIPPWNVMPLCCGIMVFGSVLFLNLNIDFVLLKVASLTWFTIGWVVVVLIISRAKWNGLVIQGILTSKGVLRTSPLFVMLCEYMWFYSGVTSGTLCEMANKLWSSFGFLLFCAWVWKWLIIHLIHFVQWMENPLKISYVVYRSYIDWLWIWIFDMCFDYIYSIHILLVMYGLMNVLDFRLIGPRYINTIRWVYFMLIV